MKVRLPESYRAEVRAMVDEAARESSGLSDEMREQFTRRLEALDKKESYLLDLAAEEDWPKDKLREKIAAIRTERRDIAHSLAQTETQLDTGANTLRKALALLDTPAQMYAEGDEVVRSILNKAFFTRFMINGEKIMDSELKEPFDVMTDVSEREEARVYLREVGRLPGHASSTTDPDARASRTKAGRGQGKARQTATLPALVAESRECADEPSLTDLLELALTQRARVLVGRWWWARIYIFETR